MHELVLAVSNVGGVLRPLLVANLDTTRVTDEGSTRTVMIVSLTLVAVAVVLIAVTLWFWRRTVPDPDALESLAFFEERVIDATEDVSLNHPPRHRHDGRHRGERRRSD